MPVSNEFNALSVRGDLRSGCSRSHSPTKAPVTARKSISSKMLTQSTIAESIEDQANHLPGSFENTLPIDAETEVPGCNRDGTTESPTLQPVQQVPQNSLRPSINLAGLLNTTKDPTDSTKGIYVDPQVKDSDVQAYDQIELVKNITAQPRLWFSLVRRLCLQYDAKSDRIDALEEQAHKDAKIIDNYEREIETYHSQQPQIDKTVTKSKELEANVRHLEELVKALRGRVSRRDATIETMKKEHGTELHDATMIATSLRADLDAAEDKVAQLEEKTREQSKPRRQARATSISPLSNRGRSRRSDNDLRGLTPSPDATQNRREATHFTAQTQPTTATVTMSKLKIPDPEIFYGDRAKYEDWLTKMRVKIRYNIESDQMAVDYISTRVGGNAFEAVKNHLPGSAKPYQNAEEMFKTLTVRFGELDRALKARTKFDTIRQGDSEDFELFYTRFDNCVSLLDLSDSELIHQLKSKLNNRYLSKVNDGTHYQTLPDIVSRCQRLTYTFAENDAFMPRNRNNKPQSAPTGCSQQPRTGQAATPNTTARVVFPEKYKNLPKLTPELRLWCDKERRCYSCREKGHNSIDSTCPLWTFRQ
jgi:putative ubiquitin-RnfH superfamily antitoxin RatB of RatAB toxin-antitoxin module